MTEIPINLRLTVSLKSNLKPYMERATAKTSDGQYVGIEEIQCDMAQSLIALAKTGMENMGLPASEIARKFDNEEINLSITIKKR